MLSSSMMGQSGPWSILPGYGDLLSAISGVNEISGWPDHPPSEIGYYTDYVAPRFNAMTLLAAIDYWRRTGKGQYLDIAQHQGGLQYVLPLILDYQVNRRVAGRNGNRDDYASPHGLFRSQGEDRYIAIAVYTEAEWQALCRIAGDQPWTKDPRFATFADRKANEDELEALVLAWTLGQNDEQLMLRLQGEGVGAGMLMDPVDYLERNEHIKAREFYVELDHPEIGKIHAPRQPSVLSKTPCRVTRAPLMGEHTEFVCKEFLHMTDDEIGELVVEEVLY
jgi:crotonobetainyl-CoA:carnitine CoA-transferase CaiB-like acyl-CoA transferase